MEYRNELSLSFLSLSENEGFARSCVASFCLPLNPSIELITDIKTAVSEAVTNCVVHAYPSIAGNVCIKVKLYENSVDIEIIDNGIGIKDFEKAKEPFYTTKAEEERSGMGFAVMESFMDKLTVRSKVGVGTTVTLCKIIKGRTR